MAATEQLPCDFRRVPVDLASTPNIILPYVALSVCECVSACRRVGMGVGVGRGYGCTRPLSLQGAV